MSLVIRVKFVTEGLASGIENNRNQVMVNFSQQLIKHITIAENRIDVCPVGARHRWQGVESPENKAGTIYEIKFGHKTRMNVWTCEGAMLVTRMEAHSQ